jgi:hypothetical protein
MKQSAPFFLLIFTALFVFPSFIFAAETINVDLQAETVYTQCSQTPANDTEECIAACPAGTVLAGGGINIFSFPQLNIVLSAPDASNNRFRCYALSEDDSEGAFYFCYANCLSAEVSIPRKAVVIPLD